METKPKCPIHGVRYMNRSNSKWDVVKLGRHMFWICRAYGCNFRIEIK